MASNVLDERSELQDDDEKLQAALHEFSDQWGSDIDDYSSEDENEEEEEDQLLIDLEYEKTSEQTAQSTTPSFVGSVSRSQSDTAADEESGETAPRPSLELPSQIDVIEHRNDPEKTLHLNRILQEILEEHINDIKEALTENKEKQARLEENVLDSTTKPEKKSIYSGAFRAPYFRHINSYPPSNEDVVQKKISGDYDISVDSFKDLRQFKKTAKVVLRDAVIQDWLEQMLKPFVAKMEIELKKKEASVNECDSLSLKLESETARLEELQNSPRDCDIEHMIEEVKKTIEELKRSVEEKRKVVEESKQEITRLEQEIQNKRNTPEDKILAAVDTNKVDWMKIAKHNFGGNSSWLDCQKAWENYVSPVVNKKAWTKDEDKSLIKLVSKSTIWSWEEIAKALGNGRTPFQCFSRYQQRFNSDLKPRPWTEDEDARLIRITNNVKDSVGFFSWSKVSSLMDSRSPVECMYRFTKVDPSQSRGRWTELEDTKLLAAVEMIGPCWSKVSKFIGTRNMVQCRDRYLNCLAPNINFSHFTYDEDVKLLKLYKKFGPTWAKMVPEFLGRTDSMLLTRYRQLQKWKQQSEWFNRQTDATKKMLLGKSLTVAERQRYQARAEDYMKVQLGIDNEDYKRQELDRQNHVEPDIIPPRPPRHLRCYNIAGPSKSGSINKWSVKLDIHRRLTESLHRLLAKETENNRKKKSKGNLQLAADVQEQIMHQSVKEALSKKSTAKTINYTKVQAKKLEAALNKVFLTEGTVSVQELLQAKEPEKKRSKKVEKNSIIDSELKSILRRRSRTLSKLGRSRRFFEKDTRPAKIIEEELDELDQAVPLMIMKNLGVDIHYLCDAAQLQCLKFQEELSKQPSYENDEYFQREDTETREAIEKLLARSDITDSHKQKLLGTLKRKLKSLRKIYEEKRFLNSKIIENNFSTFQDDLDYMETIVDEKMEMEVNKNLSLMVCCPHSNLETEFEAEITDSRSPLLASDSLNKTISSFIQPSSFVEMSQSQPSAQSPNKRTFSCVSKSYGEQDSSVNNEFAVPNLPPKRTRTSYRSKYVSESELSKKRLKILSKEEIAEKRRKLSNVKKTIFTKLPNLPPDLSTLLGLRLLLLMKYNLINTAGCLYKSKNHATSNDTTSQLVTSIVDETQCDKSTSATTQGVKPEDSGSWFLYTSPQQLTEQASSFQGYVGHLRELGQRTLADHSEESAEFQNEALVFPLEERGGHLPNSCSRSHHDHNKAALKPITCNEKVVSASNASEMMHSNYEIVMGFSGCHSEEDTVTKASERHTSKNTANNLTVVTSNVSINPASLIKTNFSTLTVNPTISVSSYHDEVSSITVSSCRDALVETSSNIRSDGRMYSHYTTGQPEDQDDEGDVVAVIHIDNDDGDTSITPTVINICSDQTSSNWSELTAGNDIFSENGEAFELIDVTQETDQYRELTGMELPESCVSSIMKNQNLQNHKSRIVIVGVDEESKTIVHFKSEDDRFTAFETLETSLAEARSNRQRNPSVSAQEKKKEKTREVPDCMKVIRNTDEYKLLLTRFRALFMWPVLMSTLKPSPFNPAALPAKLSKYNLPRMNKEKKKRKKKRSKIRKSTALREHLLSIRKSSLESRAKKRAQKMTRIASNVDKKMETEESAGVSLEQQATVSIQAEENEQQESSETVEKSVTDTYDEGSNVMKRAGRPKGSKTKKLWEVVLREKSQRVANKVKTVQQPKEAHKEHARSLPQWWKDAVLAVMLAKKAMEIDGEEDIEVNIEDDEDFIDKNNYSDDEWYQQLRQEEMKEAILKSHDVYISDAEETDSAE